MAAAQDEPVARTPPTDVPGRTWEGLTADALAVRWGLPEVHLYESVGSTNDVARRLASAGAASGTLVLAERQVAGRGREGRPWLSPHGSGIWASMIVRRPGASGQSALLPLRAGIAVTRALAGFRSAGGLGVKWPNDVLIGDRKVGGVLCEGTWTGSAPGPVIVGVGLNVLQTEDEFPEDVRSVATSVRAAAREAVDRLRVADALVPRLHAELVQAPLADRTLASEMEERDVLRGRRIAVTDTAGAPRLTGTAAGIALDGALRVRTDEGVVELVRSGSVRPLDGGAVDPRTAR